MLTFDEALAVVLADGDRAACTVVPWVHSGRVTGIELWSLVRHDDEDGDEGDPWRVLYSDGVFGSSSISWDVIFPEDIVPAHPLRSKRFRVVARDLAERVQDLMLNYALAELEGYEGDPDGLAADRVFLDGVRAVWSV